MKRQTLKVKKYVWLKNVFGKPIKVLKKLLHKDEASFLAAGNEVDYDFKRHRKKVKRQLASQAKRSGKSKVK